MSTIVAFRFPAGRYHATPWETHVNEGEIEWPPSPWRVLRALVAVWHRKVDPQELSEEVLETIINTLAGARPRYRLPPAIHAHARHYMPERQGKGERRMLIFDAFGRVDPDQDLVMAWPDMQLDDESRTGLERLLRRLGYLGRAESWVEARLLDGWEGAFDCVPMDGAEGGEAAHTMETVRLPVPVPLEAYMPWRDRKVRELGLDGQRLNKTQRRLLATLPERLLDALRLESGDVRREGWSRPPGIEYALYRRPASTVRPAAGIAVTTRPPRPVTTVRLVLSGKPLPRITDAVRVGELVRFAAIRKADDAAVEDGEIPSVLSGHGMGPGNRHEHAFYLPEDEDGDGRLDHVLIHADAGFDLQVLAALDRIRRIWEDQGNEWRVALEGYGSADGFAGHVYIGPSRVWTSATPYLHPWHRKKAFGVPEQILRECEGRGLPRPEIEKLSTVTVKGRKLRPVHFHRFRRKRGLRQPDTRGSFWRLRFPEPVGGPLALGFACHFGLGVFRAEIS